MDENTFNKVKLYVEQNEFKRCFAWLDEMVENIPFEQHNLNMLKNSYNLLQNKRIQGILEEEEFSLFQEDVLSYIELLEERVQNSRIHRRKTITDLEGISTIDKIRCQTCESSHIQVVFLEKQEIIECFDCKTIVERFIPPKYELPVVDDEGFTTDKQREFERLMTFCRHDIILGDYESAFDNAEKAINLGFDIQEAWEYYALCYYYKTEKSEIINTNANEILAALKTSIVSKLTEPFRNSETREVIGRGLASAVKRRYEVVEPNLEANRWELVKYLQVWFACYEIFNSKAFLEAIIEEMVGQGKLEWFILNLHNEEVSVLPSLLEAEFDTKNILKKALNELYHDDKKYLAYLHQTKINLAENAGSETFSIYLNTLRNNNKSNNYQKENSTAEIQTIINCIQTWQKIYDINQNAFGVKLSIEELACNKKICWFDLNSKGQLIEQPHIISIGFRPFLTIQKMAKLGKTSLRALEKSIKLHISQQMSYENEEFVLLLMKNKELNDLVLQQIEGLLDRWRICYLASGDDQFIKRALAFLTHDRYSLIFFDLENKQVVDGFSTKNNYSLVHEIKKFCTWLKETEWDEQVMIEKVKYNLIVERFYYIQEDYKKAIKTIKKYNNRTNPDIIAIHKSIIAAKELFYISGNDDHLIWAIDELAGLGESGIHWFLRTKDGNKMINPRIKMVISDDLYFLWDELTRLVNTVKIYAPPVISEKATFIKRLFGLFKL